MFNTLVIRPCRHLQIEDLGMGHNEYMNFTCEKHRGVLTSHDLISCLGTIPKDKMNSCYSCYEEQPHIIHNPVTGKDYEVKLSSSRKKDNAPALWLTNPKKRNSYE